MSRISTRRRRLPRRPAVEGLERRVLFATLTWVGDIDGDWGTGTSGVNTNWSPNVLPQNGDTLVFAAGGRAASSNDLSGLSLAAVQITGTGSGGGGRYSISGNEVTLTGATGLSITTPADFANRGPRFVAPIKLGAATS